MDLDPFLRKRRVSARQVIDGRGGPIGKRNFYPIVLIAVLMPPVVERPCLDLDRGRVREVIREVDEMARFAEESPASDLGIQEPVILGKWAGIDPAQEP